MSLDHPEKERDWVTEQVRHYMQTSIHRKNIYSANMHAYIQTYTVTNNRFN